MPVVAQDLAEAFHGGTGGAVDDAALVLPLLDEPEQDRRLVAWGGARQRYRLGRSNPVTMRNGLPQLQAPHDVLLHLRRSSGGEGAPPQDALAGAGRRRRCSSSWDGNPAPTGRYSGLHPPPRGARTTFRHESGKLRRIQSLRRHIQKLVRPRSGTLVHQLHLLDGEGAVQNTRPGCLPR